MNQLNNYRVVPTKGDPFNIQAFGYTLDEGMANFYHSINEEAHGAVGFSININFVKTILILDADGVCPMEIV